MPEKLLIELIMLSFFNILINKGLPGRLVKIIIDWYGKTFSAVKWNECFSESRIVKSGIRQGGILSPIFTARQHSLLCRALY